MKISNLVRRTTDTSNLFRTIIPQDLIEYFKGRTRFHISLKNVSNKESRIISVYLRTLTQQLFNDIRKGMKSLTLEDVKEILRVEVRKSILHSHQVNQGQSHSQLCD